MKPSAALALHCEALRLLIERYGLLRPRVCGCVLTQTDTEDSDRDALVHSVPGITLFTLIGLEHEAQPLTGGECLDHHAQVLVAYISSLGAPASGKVISPDRVLDHLRHMIEAIQRATRYADKVRL